MILSYRFIEVKLGMESYQRWNYTIPIAVFTLPQEFLWILPDSQWKVGILQNSMEFQWKALCWGTSHFGLQFHGNSHFFLRNSDRDCWNPGASRSNSQWNPMDSIGILLEFHGKQHLCKVPVLYPPPWVLADSTGIPQNVGIWLGIHENGRNVQFPWKFLWIPSGIWVEFPWNLHSNSRMIPSGIWMEFRWLLSLISVKIEFNINIYQRHIYMGEVQTSMVV